jgi:complex III assembly factor LYRM7
MALAAYRHLLRSTRIAFQGKHFAGPCIVFNSHLPNLRLQERAISSANFITGDLPLLHASRQEARNAFLKNASLTPADPSLAPAIAHAEEVAKILRENIVQGKNLGDDKYSKPHHSFAIPAL